MGLFHALGGFFLNACEEMHTGQCAGGLLPKPLRSWRPNEDGDFSIIL
jgi:hypothetical protein